MKLLKPNNIGECATEKESQDVSKCDRSAVAGLSVVCELPLIFDLTCVYTNGQFKIANTLSGFLHPLLRLFHCLLVNGKLLPAGLPCRLFRLFCRLVFRLFRGFLLQFFVRVRLDAAHPILEIGPYLLFCPLRREVYRPLARLRHNRFVQSAIVEVFLPVHSSGQAPPAPVVGGILIGHLPESSLGFSNLSHAQEGLRPVGQRVAVLDTLHLHRAGQLQEHFLDRFFFEAHAAAFANSLFAVIAHHQSAAAHAAL